MIDYQNLKQSYVTALHMAKLHAEWSKKYYDVFVTLLKDWQAK